MICADVCRMQILSHEAWRKGLEQRRRGLGSRLRELAFFFHLGQMILGQLKQKGFDGRSLDGGRYLHAFHEITGHIAEHPRSRFGIVRLFLCHIEQ